MGEHMGKWQDRTLSLSMGCQAPLSWLHYFFMSLVGASSAQYHLDLCKPAQDPVLCLSWTPSSHTPLITQSSEQTFGFFSGSY